MANIKDEEIIDTADYGKLYKSDYDKLVKSGDIREYIDNPNQGDFSRGISSGTEGVKSSLYGALGAVGDALGSNNIRDYGVKKAEQSNRFAGYYGNKDNYSIEGINGVGSAIDYAQYQLGNAIPSLVSSLAGGGLGALGGKLAAKSLVKNEVDDLVKQQITKSTINKGLTAGLFGSSAIMEGGQIYPDALKDNQDNALSNAVVGGLLGGAVETVADKMLLGKLLGEGTSGNLLQRIGKGAGKSFVSESSTETLQQANQRYFSGKDLTGKEAMSEYANSFVAGGLSGGLLGGAGSALNKTLSQEEKDNLERTSNNEELKNLNQESNNINSNIGKVNLNLNNENVRTLDLGGYDYNSIINREDLQNLSQEDITKEKVNIRNKIVESGLSKNEAIKLSNDLNNELQKNYIERKSNTELNKIDLDSNLKKQDLNNEIIKSENVLSDIKDNKIIPVDENSVNLSDRINENKNKIQTITSNKEQLLSSKVELESKLSDLNNSSNETISLNKDIENSINDVKNKIEETKKSIIETNKNTDLEDKDKIFRLKTLKDTLKNFNKQNSDLVKKSNEFSLSQKDNLENTKNEYNNKIEEINNQLKNHDSEISTLNKSIENDNKEYESYVNSQKNEISNNLENNKEIISKNIDNIDNENLIRKQEVLSNIEKEITDSKINEDKILNQESYFKTIPDIVELTNKEKEIDTKRFNIVNNELNKINKQFNFTFNLKNSKQSQYGGDVEGYYSNRDGSITIFYDKIKDLSRIKELALHELQHKGALQVIKGNDAKLYFKQLDFLYENDKVKLIADELNTKLNDKYKSIEEAVSKIAETVEFKRLTGYRRFINFMKDFINKIVGKNYLKEDSEVINYIIRNIDSALMQDIINKSIDDTVLFSRTFDNTEPSQIIINTEKSDEELLNIIKEDILIKNTKVKENSIGTGDIVKDTFDSVRNNFVDLKTGVFTRGQMNRFSNFIKSFREKIKERNNPILNKILATAVDVYEKNLRFLNQASKDVFIDDVKSITGNKHELFTKVEQLAVEDILNELTHTGTKKTNESLLYSINSDNRIKNKDLAVKYYNSIIKGGELIVNTTSAQDVFETVNNILSTSDKNDLNNETITLIRDLESSFLKDFDYNKLFESVKNVSELKLVYNKTEQELQNDKNEIENIVSKEENTINNINDYLNKLSEIIKDRESEIKNGYLPKDHSGKFVVRAYFVNSKGEKTYFLVDGSNSLKDANDKENKYLNHLEELKKSGNLPDNILIEVENTERVQNSTDNMTPAEMINNLERNFNVELNDEQKKNLFLYAKSIQKLKRNFKLGIGNNTNFVSIINKQINSYNSQLLRTIDSYTINKELNKINPTENPTDRNLAIAILERRSSVDDYNTLQAKARGFASLWYLGYNISSAVLQFTSMVPAASIWMGQYNNTNNFSNLIDSVKLATKFIKTGTTGNIDLDNAMKNFESNLLDIDNVRKIYTGNDYSNHFNEPTIKDKAVEYAFMPFSTVEKLNRISNFIASYKMYENREELNKTNKVKIQEDFTEFAKDNIIKVNGDYSAFNRPDVLQGDTAQLILMYKQFLLVAYEMFKVLDNKDKAKFIGALVLTSGFAGLPGYQDLEKIIDFFFKIFGIPISLKGKTNKMFDNIGNTFGVDNFETYARNGIIPSLGTRQGLGQVLPFIGVLDLASNQTLNNTSASSLGGPAIGLAVKNVLGIGDLMQGSKGEAFKQLAPSAFANLYKGIEAGVYGGNVNKQGTKLNTINSDGLTGYAENLGKMFGFQSVNEISEYSKQGIISDMKSVKKIISESYRNDYLRAKFSGDNELANDIFRNALEYNKQSKILKDGYDIELNRKNWDKSFLDSKKTISQRTINKESKETRKILKDLNL